MNDADREWIHCIW